MMQRKIDKLRRVYIPNEIFKERKFSEEQEVEITIEYGEICIKKFHRENLQIKPYIGIVRNIDGYRRVGIPAEYLSLLGIGPGDKVDMTIEDGIIKFH